MRRRMSLVRVYEKTVEVYEETDEFGKSLIKDIIIGATTKTVEVYEETDEFGENEDGGGL
jgi:hypothetical protein